MYLKKELAHHYSRDMLQIVRPCLSCPFSLCEIVFLCRLELRIFRQHWTTPAAMAWLTTCCCQVDRALSTVTLMLPNEGPWSRRQVSWGKPC